jgi:hypothetical protein
LKVSYITVGRATSFIFFATDSFEMAAQSLDLKQIPGFPNYFASKDGNIWLKSHKKLDVKISLTGYRWVYLRHVKGFPVCRFVGRLILETFVGSRPSGCVVCHGFGGKLDDSLENLSWQTRSNNALSKIKDGKTWKSYKNPEEILKIRQLEDRLPVSTVAWMFDLSKTQVYRIWKKENWSWLN